MKEHSIYFMVIKLYHPPIFTPCACAKSDQFLLSYLLYILITQIASLLGSLFPS